MSLNGRKTWDAGGWGNHERPLTSPNSPITHQHFFVHPSDTRKLFPRYDDPTELVHIDCGLAAVREMVGVAGKGAWSQARRCKPDFLRGEVAENLAWARRSPFVYHGGAVDADQTTNQPTNNQRHKVTMRSTTLLASLLASTSVLAQNITTTTVAVAASSKQFNLACYPTMPGGGYTFGPGNPFPSPSNNPPHSSSWYSSASSSASSDASVLSTTVTAYVPSGSAASTGLPTGGPVSTMTNGMYVMPTLKSTVYSTYTASGSPAGSVGGATTTRTTFVTAGPASTVSAASGASSASGASVSAAAAATYVPASNGASSRFSVGAEGFFVLGLAGLVVAAAL
ncbi:hypothetical protein LTR53_004031 [Teratosphaeriaceae sp. CCFEE 6253]|nr:hypothetical protein LTR53_004031 [Teratosphaeriaceae sp. CCFEE 6253]